MKRTGLILAALLTIAGLVTACSSSNIDQPSPGTGQNQQDANFAVQLNELSEQLISISDVLLARTNNKAAQTKLEQLARTGGERSAFALNWLSINGRTNATAPPAPGILTEAQFDRLTLATGPALAAAIAQVAAIQAEGTRQIANEEIENGQNAELVNYARQLLEQIDAETQILTQSGV